MKQIQIITTTDSQPYDVMSSKRREIGAKGGTLGLSSASEPGAEPREETWTHKKYGGGIRITATDDDLVLAHVWGDSSDNEAIVLGAFLSWIFRNCGDIILAVNIQFT